MTIMIRDLFDEDMPDDWIDRVFSAMAMERHIFMVMTKHAFRMRQYLNDAARCGTEWCRQAGAILGRDPGDAPEWPLPNVWLGVSVEDQPRADERIPELLATPAAKRFISAAPLLGPIDLSRYLVGREDNGIVFGRPAGACIGWTPPLDWVIVSGESGPKARPMHPDWVRSLRDQCQAGGVPFFFKQWGEWAPPLIRRQDSSGREALDLRDMVRVGKKVAGRLLDHKEWSEMPGIM